MKTAITIVTNDPKSWRTVQLKRAAKELGISIKTADFSNLELSNPPIDELGGLIIWLNSSLDRQSERAALGQLLLTNKYIINASIFTNSYVTHKLYQHVVVDTLSGVKTIPTFRFRDQLEFTQALKAGALSYPVLAKLNFGTLGRDMCLINSAKELSDIDYDKYIFQPFIPSDGYWRVLVLGGRVLGAVKNGSRFNNQGGQVFPETNDAVLKKLADMATEAATTLGYTFCGVDIMRHKETGEYFFLEANSTPRWDGEPGFQTATGKDVAKEIMAYCAKILQRGKRPVAELIRDYYASYSVADSSETFRFNASMYLWSGDKKLRKTLSRFRKSYVAEDQGRDHAILKLALEAPAGELALSHVGTAYLKKYNKLPGYLNLLTHVLLTESIYGVDLRGIARGVVSDDELWRLHDQLAKDSGSIRTLPHLAIPYIYYLRFYLGENDRQVKSRLLKPSELIKMSSGSVSEQIKLFTSLIVADSKFYTRPVVEVSYSKAIRQLEQIIKQHYFKVALESKLEFLVATRLCGFKSALQPLIAQEAELSLSPHGNYLVDVNSQPAERTFEQSRYRSLLYVLSRLPHEAVPQRSARKLVKAIGDQISIQLSRYGIGTVEARIDTGAQLNVIHCSEIKPSKDGQFVSFVLLDPNHPQFTGQKINEKVLRLIEIKNSFGKSTWRYAVNLEFQFAGRRYLELFTLADRSKMTFPVLLGRRFLENRFLVEVGHQEADNESEKEQ